MILSFASAMQHLCRRPDERMPMIVRARGNDDGEARALAWRALDLQRAAELRHALANPEQAEMTARDLPFPAGAQPLPVVRHDQRRRVGLELQVDVDAVRRAVLD